MRLRSAGSLSVVLWVALLGIVTGCGAASTSPQSRSAPPAARQTAQPATAPASPTAPAVAVTLRTAYLPSGVDAAFALGVVKGFYKDQGLDVTMSSGKGSVITGESVASGHDTFGHIDTAASIQLISKGAPLKVLAVYSQSSPYCFVMLPPTTLKSAADLKGKTIFSAPGGGDYLLLPAVLAKGGLSLHDVHVVQFNPQEEPTILASHATAVLTGYANGTYLRVLPVSPNATCKAYSDFGVNLYNLGLVANTSEIASRPDVVRRFMIGSTKAWEYAIDHQDEAVAAELKLFPDAKESVIKLGFAKTVGLIHTAASKGHVVGWMAPSDWTESLDLMQQYGKLTPKPADTYYTNEFLPSQ